MFLYIFVDGVGFGEANSEINPFAKFGKGFFMPLGGKSPLSNPPWNQAVYLKTDASMGVSGIPQSATGQTAIWTGFNASKIVGRHISGFPTFTLKKIINEYSIIKVFKEKGYKASFLNCYNPKYIEHIQKNPRHQSASTLIQLAGGNTLKTFDDLRAGKGIYMDISHHFLREFAKDILSPDDELMKERDPYMQGKLLAQIAEDYDLCIYEFFLTDKVGHDQNWEAAERIIYTFEKFMDGLVESFNSQKGQIILTSDHGNMEDLSIGKHTTNLVPCFLYGKHTQILKDNIVSLHDITPNIYKIMGIDIELLWNEGKRNV